MQRQQALKFLLKFESSFMYWDNLHPSECQKGGIITSLRAVTGLIEWFFQRKAATPQRNSLKSFKISHNLKIVSNSTNCQSFGTLATQSRISGVYF